MPIDFVPDTTAAIKPPLQFVPDAPSAVPNGNTTSMGDLAKLVAMIPKPPLTENTIAGPTAGVAASRVEPLLPSLKDIVQALPDSETLHQLSESTSRGLPMPQFQVSPTEGVASATGKTIANMALSVPSFLTSPQGVATLATGSVLPRLVAGLFGGLMSKEAIQQGAATKAQWQTSTPAEKAVGTTTTIGDALMALLGAKGVMPTRSPVLEAEVMPPEPMQQQLPYKSQDTLAQEAAARQARVEAANPPAPTGPTFVADWRTAVPVTGSLMDELKQQQLAQPAGLLKAPEPSKLEQRVAALEQAQQQVKSQPPIIGGVTDVTGQQGVHPVTRPQIETQSAAPVQSLVQRLQPALMVGDQPVTGATTHAGILDAIRTKQIPVDLRAGMEAFLDDSKHVFVDTSTGQVYDRRQAAQALGVGGELHSQELNKLKEVPNASTIRSNPGQLPPQGMEQEGRGNRGSENIQQAPEEGTKTGDQGGTVGTKYYGGIPFTDPDLYKPIVNKVAEMIRTKPVRDTMAYMKDATSNLVAKNANEAASTVSGMLERATGVKDKPDSLPRQALMFVVEAEQNPTKLSEFRQQLVGASRADMKDKADALSAINYAMANFQKLAPVAAEYSRIMEDEAQREEASGRSIERRRGYVMHLAEDTGDATSFVHAREFNTMADRIAAGVPKGSLDAVELLRSRVARGQQVYVQSRVFLDNVRRLKDKDGSPIIGEYKKVERGPGKEPDYQVPEGYTEVKIGYNQVPVLNGYAAALKDLTEPSWFLQGTLRKGLMEFRGFGKHVALGFDTYHLGRLAMYTAGAHIGMAKIPELAYKKGVLVLDNSPAELQAKAKAGQIDAKDLPALLDAKRKIDLGIKTGFNVNRVIDSFNQHWTEKIPVTGQFQNWLFHTFQRGVMADIYAKAFDVYKQQMPKATDAGVARQLSKDLNEVFGTIGRQGLVRSRTGQDILSLLFLAPQWKEGRIRTDVSAITGSAKAAGQLATGKRPTINMQTRVVGSIILMNILANQAINMMTRGHSTFDNEKGHELDAYIPDKLGGSAGYWLNPTANAEEVVFTMNQALQREGGDYWQAWLDFVNGNLSTVARPAAIGITGRKYGFVGPYVDEPTGKHAPYGGPSGKAKFEAMAENVLQPPIGSASIVDLVKDQPDKETERQMLARVGAKVTPVETPKPTKKKSKRRHSIVE